MERKDILERKDHILNWIKEKQSKAFMCRQLKCKPETLNNYLKKMDIVYIGNQGGKGIKTDPKRRNAIEYSKLTLVRSAVLKKKLIEEGYKEDKCESCGLVEWLGVKLSLELHHKDGDRFNNKFENLEILCPNCHSITPNFRGRKVK